MPDTHLSVHPDIHLRLVNATDADVDAIIRQTGASHVSSVSDCDLVVRYVSRLETKQPLRHLMMGDAGFTDEEFWVFMGRDHACLVLGDSERVPEIICASGTSQIPMLTWMIHLAAIGKGILPMHASAFCFQGHGVVASGWPKGGKTSSLFAFLAHDAQFISDDWLYIDRDGMAYGIPQPIKLSDWQLAQLPQIRSRVPASKLQRMRIVRAVDTFERRIPERWRRGFAPATAFHQVVHYLNKKQRHVYLKPQDLFGQGVEAFTGNIETVLITLSHESSEIVVRETSVEEAVERLTYAQLHEWQELRDIYIQYRYAFPHLRVEIIDQLESCLRQMLTTALHDKQILTVMHPHPVPLNHLFESVAPRIIG